MSAYKTLKPFIFPIILLTAISLGGFLGYYFPEEAKYLKPFGDIFLNLMFTAIVPLIFFSVSLAVARAGGLGTLGRIMLCMMVVFVFTGAVAAVFGLLVVGVYPPAQGVYLPLSAASQIAPVSIADQIVGIFTVPSFAQLLTQDHILALIVFSILIGLAVNRIEVYGKKCVVFLQAGEELFLKVFALIMYYAPIGFFAYFAVLVSELGPKLMESYARVALLYYVAAVVYFFVFYTLYAYLAGGKRGINLFWRNVFLPAITALATCSSAASIPANLVASKKMEIAPEIVETAIPLGTIIHKDGSVIGGVFKIAFLFGIFQLSFSEPSVLLMAFAVSLLVGTVMGAIPSGGMLGELLILSVYGFPPSVLVVIAAISIIIDPIATMLNVTGNSVSSMMIGRLVNGFPGTRFR